MGLDCGPSKTLDMKVFVILLLVGVVLAQKGIPPSKGGKGGWSPPSGWTPPPKGDTGGKGGKGGKGGWTPPPKSTPTGGNGGKGGNGGNGGSGGNTPTEAPVNPNEKPTDPTKCSDANQGRCECGDESKGFTTYTFWQFDVQRCFTVYQPLDRAGQVLPVVFAPNCYATDKLSGIEGISPFSKGNQAAARYGFARIGISTPNHNWEFGNNNIINDDKPMPCSDDDSEDIAYVRKIIEFLESHPEQFDASRMWSQGFSQNSMFSAYIGFCFPDQILGVYQGGSGMALNGLEPNLPGCQGQVTSSQFAQCKDNNVQCQQCAAQYPCEDCQYWPIYPCYNSARPMVDCLVEYDNDAISVGKVDKTASSARYMYEKLKNEGHDARLLRFSPSEDGTIVGNHKDVKNLAYWQVGCLGITEACSASCSQAFEQCVESGDVSTAENRTKAFETCIAEAKFTSLGCQADCAPTFEMLATSEMPTEVEFDNFGAGTGTAGAQPDSSLCTIA